MTTATLPSHFDRYLAVCKPKVVALIVFTAVVGMLLAVPGLPPALPVLLATLGIALASASAAAINHVIDRREDAVMTRTRHRPLPTGQLSVARVGVFAGVLGVLGIAILWAFVNPLTAALTFASLIGYAVIYTLFLKRATPQNIVIGGAAGAAPPLLGWIAMTGTLDAPAFVLFLIIYAWTPPHFWALALYRRQDYAAVDIPMLPVTHGVPFTRWQILFYTLILFVVTLLPYLIGMSGLFYLGGAVVLGVAFLALALRLLATGEDRVAIQMFSYSIVYLMVLFTFLLVDHYLPLPHPLEAGAPLGLSAAR